MKAKKHSKEYLDHLRHSAAHLLAAAVMELYPKAKRTIGPSIEDGFYFDFDFGDTSISENDLPKIEKEMRKLLPKFKGFEKSMLTPDAAKAEYPENQYKHELIDEFSKKGEKLSFYKSVGLYSNALKKDYWDLCRGGHIDHPSKELKHFKLLSIAGAYWRGDEKNTMLTRIYGTAFPSKKELDDYLEMQKEAEMRDHRRLGRELDLFTFSDDVGSGLPLYTPRGTLVRQLLNGLIEEEQVKLGYQQVWTPQIAKASLFQKSGHYDKYKEDMFRVVSNYSDEEFYLKPMNCPQHTQIYSSRARSYRDLPLRFSDFAMLYRDEKPGELSGLARVRSFSTDDCHIFCREDQVDEEIDKALQMTKKVMSIFGFKYRYRLSTRDMENTDKYLGNPKTWDRVEKWAEKIMDRNDIEHYDAPGEAAFYAPKMDLMATDALGREWQLSTIQIDYVQPERFGLYYINEKGDKETPIMIHRAVLGSSERFMMIVLEHFAGSLPLWLSPLQVQILPITDKQSDYAKKIADELLKKDIRVEVDERNETLQAKIRDAQMQKVPYMVILGGREEDVKKVTVRARNGEDLGQMDIDEFIKRVKTEIEKKIIA